MSYKIEPGKVLRARLEPRTGGINPKETHARLITDIEHLVLSAWFRAKRAGLDGLADQLLEVGLDWEHFEALFPDSGERSEEDVARLEKLTEQTEILVATVDVQTGRVTAQGKPIPPVRPDPHTER